MTEPLRFGPAIDGAYVGMCQIVARAGAHLPAVNYYFGSKEQLLASAIVEALRRWSRTTMNATDVEGGTPRDRLFAAFDRFLVTLETDRRYVVAVMEAFAQAERSEDLREELAEAYRAFRAEVARGIQRAAGQESDEPDSEAVGLASVLIALFDGLAVQWLIAPADLPDAQGIVRALDALAASIAR